MHKAQIAFRDAVTDYDDGRTVRLMIGTMLVPEDAVEAECAHRVFLRGGREDGKAAQFGLNGKASVTPDAADTFDSSLGGVVGHHLKVATPEFPENLLSFGSAFVRKTVMPSPNGFETLAVMGIVVTSPDAFADPQVIHEFHGAGTHMKETAVRPEPELFVMGSTPDQNMALPLWGFDSSLRAFSGTLNPEFAAILDRYSDLREREQDGLTDTEKAEFERLMGDCRVTGFYSVSENDEIYQVFRSLMRERFSDGKPQSVLSCPTLEEHHAYEDAVRECVEEATARVESAQSWGL